MAGIDKPYKGAPPKLSAGLDGGSDTVTRQPGDSGASGARSHRRRKAVTVGIARPLFCIGPGNRRKHGPRSPAESWQTFAVVLRSRNEWIRGWLPRAPKRAP